jgi:hypothetical protein
LQEQAMTDDLSFLPPHEPTPVPGFHAYSTRLCVRGGDELDIRVSHDGPMTCEILRYDGPTVDDATVIDTLPAAIAALHPIHRGSYVHIEQGVDLAAPLTVEVWCRTLADAPLSGLIGQRGVHLALAEGNRPLFSVGGTAVHGPPLSLKAWHHLVGCYDGRRIALFVDGRRAASADATAGALPSQSALRLGALEDDQGRTCALFTGDLCAPGLYAALFSPRQIAARFRRRTLRRARRCLGYWKFDALHGRPYRDASGAGRHGRPVNYPIRLIPGPRRTQDSDWSTYDPAADPDFGHAVRLMADAVVDCRWPVTAVWRVPPDTPNGQYGVRVTNASGEARRIHFIVRPRRPSAKLLCLSTTNTRIAYNFRPFGNEAFDYGAYYPHPRYPMMGELLGVRRPATGELWETTTVNFELPFYAWLNAQGMRYDLYTEWDLEADPRLLDRYEAVAFAGHSEYWTPTHWESLQRFVRRGGHLLSMSGNTAYWRVSLDRANGVMEVRKHSRVKMPATPTPSTTCDPMVNAAHWHQMDHLPGATMREAGWPESSLVGSMTNGWTDPPLQGPRTGYRVLAPGHWVFHQPRPVDTAFPFAKDAAGYETDLSVRSMLEAHGRPALPMYPARDGSPPPALDSAFDAGLVVLARAILPGSVVLDYDSAWFKGEMWSEMILWERPGHGIVFAAGSVLSSHVLLTDEHFSNMVRNVLDRMGISGK